jgi:hypothetical protein
MKPAAPPLRFLLLVLGGWMGLRAILLAPGWGTAEMPVIFPAAAAATAGTDRSPPPSAVLAVPAVPAARPVRAEQARRAWTKTPARALPALSPAGPIPGPREEGGSLQRVIAPTLAIAASPAARPAGRWSASAWLLLRREREGGALAPGGTLGGSQAGLRLLYRINGDVRRPLAVGARLYLPLAQPRATEGALGFDWQPAADLPLHLLAERRQDLGGAGRSAFAIGAYGGASVRLPHGMRLDVYGQAGLVGLRARDPYADGVARLAAPIGPVELGAVLSGAAQPGATRLDLGPEVSFRLPTSAAALRLSAGWRFRVAGDAAPDSGPALTLGADF